MPTGSLSGCADHSGVSSQKQHQTNRTRRKLSCTRDSPRPGHDFFGYDSRRTFMITNRGGPVERPLGRAPSEFSPPRPRAFHPPGAGRGGRVPNLDHRGTDPARIVPWPARGQARRGGGARIQGSGARSRPGTHQAGPVRAADHEVRSTPAKLCHQRLPTASSGNEAGRLEFTHPILRRCISEIPLCLRYEGPAEARSSWHLIPYPPQLTLKEIHDTEVQWPRNDCCCHRHACGFRPAEPLPG